MFFCVFAFWRIFSFLQKNLVSGYSRSTLLWYSPTRPSGPSGPSWSTSHKVCLFIYLSPSHAIFFEASHWPSGHLIRSWPFIGPQVTWSDPGLSLVDPPPGPPPSPMSASIKRVGVPRMRDFFYRFPNSLIESVILLFKIFKTLSI